ncbi:MAG: globin [Gammaproteobacteria bacterium]|nr:globin [Gammaproteobacteria bacterium]
MKDKPSPKSLFLESLDRCSGSEDFIPAFYNRFLSSSEQIRSKFKDTNFPRQNKALLRSLRLAAEATDGNPHALKEIQERAVTHDRHHLDIEPQHYVNWLAAVIETAAQYDDQWSESVESAWRVILGHVIRHMTKHY